MREKILLATRNGGKVRELIPLFVEAGLEVETLRDAGMIETADEAALESFETFEENALAKARWFSARNGGRLVIAEDSGLTVDALAGKPGVRSKRWAADVDENSSQWTSAEIDGANNDMLQRELQSARAQGIQTRNAQFVCAAAFVLGDDECVVRGTTTGAIVEVPRGIGGFGYDPVFLSDELGVTFAEVDDATKAAVSHRGRAFRKLFPAIRRMMFQHEIQKHG